MTERREAKMTQTRTADLRAALAAALFGLGVYGCTEASGAPGPEASPVARPVAYAASVAQETSFEFDESRQDGDALVLTGVRYVLDDETTITARTVRVTGMSRSPDGAVGAERVEASGVTVETVKDAPEGEDAPDAAPQVVSIESLTIDAPKRAAPGAEASDDWKRRAATLSGVSFDRMRAEAVSFAGEGTDGTLRTLLIDGYEEGVLGEVRARNLDLNLPSSDDAVARALSEANPTVARLMTSPLGRMLMGGADRMTLDEAAWEGLDLSGVLADLEAGRAPGLDTGDIVFGDAVFRRQVSYARGEVASRTEETRLSGVRFEGVVPTAGVVVTEGAVTDMTAFAGEDDGAAASLLEARGLDAMAGRSAARFDYDPVAGRLTAASEAGLDGLYGMRMRLDVGGLSGIVEGLAGESSAEGEEATDLAGEIEAFGKFGDDVVLNALSLSVTDEQLVDTVFALAALGSDQSAMTLRQQAVGVVTLGALQGGAISPRVPDYAGAVSAFLSEGGTLTIRMAPDGGLTAAGVQAAMAADPAAILEAADLTITRTP